MAFPILDNKSGAACCTGDGDVLLRFCPSFLAVEMMHQATAPERACQEVVRRVCQGIGSRDIEMGIIAMNIKVIYNIIFSRNIEIIVNLFMKNNPPSNSACIWQQLIALFEDK